jgi:hypothetical protein
VTRVPQRAFTFAQRANVGFKYGLGIAVILAAVAAMRTSAQYAGLALITAIAIALPATLFATSVNAAVMFLLQRLLKSRHLVVNGLVGLGIGLLMESVAAAELMGREAFVSALSHRLFLTPVAAILPVLTALWAVLAEAHLYARASRSSR